jgi:CheY-like chemotaxis protein
LTNAGYPVAAAFNGLEALRLLEHNDGPRLAVLDWMMPEMDGVEVCRLIRKAAREPYIYIILLTARDHQTEIINLPRLISFYAPRMKPSTWRKKPGATGSR